MTSGSAITAIDDQVSTESGVDDQISLTESQNEEAKHSDVYFVSRPVYNKSNFFDRYNHEPNKDKSCGEKIRSLKPEVSCEKFLNVLLSFVPLLSWLPKYKLRRNLLLDIAAGLTIGVMNIPQGLAYALLASLSPIVGLYTSFLPVLVYFALGTSKHLAVGTFAIISSMVGEVCDREIDTKYNFDSTGNSSFNSSTGDNLESSVDDMKLQIAVSLTLLVGIIQAAMGLIHLGFITVYLSRPLVSGFTTGAAFIVFTSQVKYFFGVSPPRYAGALALPKTYIYIFKNISETNVAALLTGVICVIILALVDYLNKRYESRLPFPIPSQLLVIIIGAFVSHKAELNSRFDVSVVGSIPRGLPPFVVPKHKYFTDVIVDALLISIVAATTNLSLVKLFSQKHEYKTDSNQELLAYGTVNIISSFFSSFVSSGSLSRSVVQESIGKTQIASLISSFVILLVLLFIAPLFEPLPKPVLAAIVVVSLRKLFMQFQQLKTIGRISIIDAMVWLISCFAVILLGIVMGLIIGFGITLLSIIYRSSQAKVKTLGHLRQTDLYRDGELCLGTKTIKGIRVLQFQGALIFVNAEELLDTMVEMMREKCPGRHKTDSISISVSAEPEVLSNYLVEAIVTEGDKQVSVKMIRSINPMASVNMGSDDFAEPITAQEAELQDVSESNLSPEPKVSPVSDDGFHSVVLDVVSVTIVDYVGIQCLRQMIEKSKDMGVDIYLAGCSYCLQRHMARDAFLKQYAEENSFLSVHDAVLYCRRKNIVQAGRKNEEPTTSDTNPQNIIA